MGIRTAIDAVIQKTVSDQGTFRNGLDALVKRGYLGDRQAGCLDAAIEAGHAAAHRNYLPTDDELMHALEIAENLLHQIFVVEKAAQGLKRSVPPRHSRPDES